MKKPRIAAIVPAYNEEKHISDVLDVLCKTPILDEIIVVDDGSVDGTESSVKRFPRARYIRNWANHGKGYSMDRGVNSTKAEIIFFCDADLRGLTPAIVESIVTPVLEGKYVMYVGRRKNMMQRAVRFVSKLSGERALKRSAWNKMPSFYRHGFRIETGLNHFAKRYGKVGSRIFPYIQTLKEKKYGIFRGEMIRWRMNWDVVLAYLRTRTIDRRARRSLINRKSL